MDSAATCACSVVCAAAARARAASAISLLVFPSGFMPASSYSSRRPGGRSLGRPSSPRGRPSSRCRTSPPR
eukprot:2625597-Alexandrium_andersonii.AAC.1